MPSANLTNIHHSATDVLFQQGISTPITYLQSLLPAPPGGPRSGIPREHELYISISPVNLWEIQLTQFVQGKIVSDVYTVVQNDEGLMEHVKTIGPLTHPTQSGSLICVFLTALSEVARAALEASLVQVVVNHAINSQCDPPDPRYDEFLLWEGAVLDAMETRLDPKKARKAPKTQLTVHPYVASCAIL
ncbi:MAG: hypothetical protein M1829_005938 [Trizodia sp. TS-e1964]|nr:MAG: hypothetical protein M1829_005938 [Trizodia sp. TS-e1964]